MIEGAGSGAGSGSIPPTTGSGSGRPKNMWIRIRNTARYKCTLCRCRNSVFRTWSYFVHLLRSSTSVFLYCFACLSLFLLYSGPTPSWSSPTCSGPLRCWPRLLTPGIHQRGLYNSSTWSRLAGFLLVFFMCPTSIFLVVVSSSVVYDLDADPDPDSGFGS